MKKLLAVVLVLALPCTAGAFFFSPGGSSGGGSGTTNADDLSSGTVGAARGGTNIDTSASTGIPQVSAGTWTVDNAATVRTNIGADNASNLSGGTLPAARISDNSVTNDKILDETLDLSGSKFTGILPKANGGWGASVASQSGIPYFVTGTVNWDTFAAFLARMGVTFNPADNSWTFGSITFDEAVSTCVPADNNCGQTATNAGSPAGENLSAGLQWFDNTTQCFMIRNNDNTANITMSCLTKTFHFDIDNVVAVSDNNIFLGSEFSLRAATLTQIKCFASTDNVVGYLSECAADNNASCTRVDDTDWTITNATAGVTILAADFENAGIAAGASLKWNTTSVGTTNSNKLSCTIQYRE